MALFLQEFRAPLPQRDGASEAGSQENKDGASRDATAGSKPSAERVVSESWSSSHDGHALLAVATGNRVVVFLEEGEAVETAPLARACACLQVAWHPRWPLLVAGWADGAVTVWTPSADRGLREAAQAHRASIALVRWSPDGVRLVTGDLAGALCVWQPDRRGRLQQLCLYPKAGAITHCEFRGMANENTQASPPFLFGGERGTVFLADDRGHSLELCDLRSGVRSLHFAHSGTYGVVVTVDAVLVKFTVDVEGRVALDRKVKLSIAGDGENLRCEWAGPGLLAAANAESMLRLWHMEQDFNYVLPLSNARPGPGRELLTCVCFNPVKRLLAGGTTAGRVCLWRFVGSGAGAVSAAPSEKDWESLPSVSTEVGAIESLRWDSSGALLSVAGAGGALSTLVETVLHAKSAMAPDVVATQVSADKVVVQHADLKITELLSPTRIKGLDVTATHLALWSGKQVSIYAIEGGALTQVSSFGSRARAVALGPESVFVCLADRVEECNLQGVVKRSLAFAEAEGRPSRCDLWGSFLVVASDTAWIKVWDVSRREPKALVPAKSLADRLGAIVACRINCTGTRVAILANRLQESRVQVPDTRLFVYDVETDKLLAFDFGPRQQAPVSVHWDASEERLLAVESASLDLRGAVATAATTLQQSSRDLGSSDASSGTASAAAAAASTADETKSGGAALDPRVAASQPATESEITTLFATPDDGVVMQDSFSINPVLESLIGVSVPHLIFLVRSQAARSTGAAPPPRIKKRPLRDFVGLEKADAETRRDLLAFSYHVTLGNMDAAYRAVKKIQNPGVWENMARMCVKTLRLDVAEVCLANMGNARGVAALQQTKQEETDVRIQAATVALQLGMTDDAERLYREAGRIDLLVRLLQATGRWQESLELVEKGDRVHLKHAHFSYAAYLEANGERALAIKHYEKANTHRQDVPRMLHETGNIKELEAYVRASDDPVLRKWWAQYCESAGRFQDALALYQQIGDHLSAVRVLCFHGELDKAAELSLQSGDRAAAYHVARQFEAAGRVKEAIQFFGRAQCVHHGVRLAREHGMHSELVSLALESPSKQVKLDTARFLEEQGIYDRAILLYQKGGNLARAVDLAQRAQLHDSLRNLAEDVDKSNADPALLARCAEFFLQHQQYEKAVQMLAAGGQIERAVDICEEHKVRISDDLAEKLTPEKASEGAASANGDSGEASSDAAEARRIEVLKKLAKCLRDQGSYQPACQKYTKAGDRVRAIKCLIKGGETEKVVFYANATKKPEIFVLAANYLQTLDWRGDAEISRNIVAFYTKARAMEQLSHFFDAFAQQEIDEYRDYEKALGYLKEALKNLIKAKDSEVANKEQRMAQLDARIAIVQRFVNARALVATNPQEMLAICSDLIEQQVEPAIRVGDVYALMIEYHHATKSPAAMASAYELIQKMRRSGIQLAHYLDAAIMRQVYTAVGAAPQTREEAQAMGVALQVPAGAAGAAAAGGAGTANEAPEAEEAVGEEILDEQL